jgi:hypothetical protein
MMPRALVQISLSLDPDNLQAINDNIKGKTQSEKLRKCVQEGYEQLKAKK